MGEQVADLAACTTTGEVDALYEAGGLNLNAVEGYALPFFRQAAADGFEGAYETWRVVEVWLAGWKLGGGEPRE